MWSLTARINRLICVVQKAENSPAIAVYPQEGNVRGKAKFTTNPKRSYPMFSLSNDMMNKMTQDNPLLAMMQGAFGEDSEQVKKATDAWMKAMPGADAFSKNGLPAHPMAAAAATSAIGFGIYSQMVGSMFGAMSGAMSTAEKNNDETGELHSSYGMIFNPLTFDWSPAPGMSETKTGKTKTSTRNAKAPVESEAKPARVVKKVNKIASAPVTKAVPSAEPVAANDDAAEFQKPGRIARPEKPDDLKLIDGVGPKLEQVLNGLGVWTHRQIADWKPAEIAWVDDFLQFNGRIENDGWLKQASELAKRAD